MTRGLRGGGRRKERMMKGGERERERGSEWNDDGEKEVMDLQGMEG